MYDIEPGDPLRIQNKLSIYNVLVRKKTSETGQLQRVPNGDAPTLAAQYPKRPIAGCWTRRTRNGNENRKRQQSSRSLRHNGPI